MKGPVIIIVNHPSTLMDVLLPGAYIPRVMFFLANYGLFKHPISNWIFRRLYCIPVKRKEDVAEGELRDNEDAFEQSYIHLEKGGVLFIAPEGVSWMNRFVRPLKTGTARIALGAEARQNGHLGLQILPVGLSYNHPNLFRSTAVVCFGSPVAVNDWLSAWRENSPATVDALTEYLELQLQKASIHTRDEAGELFISRLEDMLHRTSPLPLAQEYERTQQLVKNKMDDNALRAGVNHYYEELEQANITDAVVAAGWNWRKGLFLLVGWPLALLGGLLWWFPCYLPYRINKQMGLYIGYSSTVKMVVGIFLSFPLFLWMVWRLGRPWFAAWWYYPLAVAGIVGLGLFTEYFYDCWLDLKNEKKRRDLGNDGVKLSAIRAQILG